MLRLPNGTNSVLRTIKSYFSENKADNFQSFRAKMRIEDYHMDSLNTNPYQRHLTRFASRNQMTFDHLENYSINRITFMKIPKDPIRNRKLNFEVKKKIPLNVLATSKSDQFLGVSCLKANQIK